MKRWLLPLVLFMGLNLGCVGLINDWSGGDVEIRLGEDAKAPADFPVLAPEGAEPVLFMKIKAEEDSLNLPEGVTLPDSSAEYVVETMTYVNVPDPAAEAAANKAKLEEAGWKFIKSDQELASYQKGDQIFVYGPSQDSWLELRISPAPAPATPPAP